MHQDTPAVAVAGDSNFEFWAFRAEGCVCACAKSRRVGVKQSLIEQGTESSLGESDVEALGLPEDVRVRILGEVLCGRDKDANDLDESGCRRGLTNVDRWLYQVRTCLMAV